MNGLQNIKGQDLQKPFPGCMGRMINIFDLSTAVTKTKQLTEKPHQDASPICGNQPDVVKMKSMEKLGAPKDEKAITRTTNMWKSSSKKSGGTSMKMLIAQEMSREIESRPKQPNAVAQLMGLDSLPMQQSVLIDRMNFQEGYSDNSICGEELRCHERHKDTFYHNVQSDTKFCAQESEFKDVYEVCQQPSRNSELKDKHLQNRRYDENPIEKRMALVHQKFTDAKHLATDEKLLKSKEFQEAIEVLSSNRDLFLKFFEEPNSIFSKHLPELQSTAPVAQTRRITVLRPSRMTEPKGEPRERKIPHPAAEDIDRRINVDLRSLRNSNVHHKAENICRPTRIVVLKPNPVISHEMNTLVTPPITSSNLPETGELGGFGPDEALESREMAKQITRQMQEYMNGNRKDEISPSALSNGYIADESSFNRSENGYIDDEGGNASDSDIMTPTSRHSWDCGYKLDSPCSISISSRASNSSEPSVIKEAKKRLSERWAMVSSTGNSQEQSQMRRSSSTLGEMLSIPEVTKDERLFGGEEEQRASTSHSFIGRIKEGGSEELSGNLTRSKSVPIYSSVYESIGLREEVHIPVSPISKSIVHKEVSKSKSGMATLKGKVSSLFFFKVKKTVKEKLCSQSVDSDPRLHSEDLGDRTDPSPGSCYRTLPEVSMLDTSEEMTRKCSSLSGPKLKASLSFEKLRISDGQDQPSPISVLEPPFDDDSCINTIRTSASATFRNPQALSRSPLIGSVSRTLSWDNSRETSQPNSIKLSRFLSRECEEQERSQLLHKLLSCTNLLHSDEPSTVLAKWHSLDTPLNPTLLADVLDRKENLKCRERRSNQRLLFDCVNAALLSIGENTLISIIPWAKSYGYAYKDCWTHSQVADEVSRLVNDWFSCEEKLVSAEFENRNLGVDKLVKEEVVGKGWDKLVCFEVDDFSKEIGGKVLEELVEEALADLTSIV